MEKDTTIIQFVQKLNEWVEFKLIEIVDYWDGDRCAIGFKKGNRLAYISTYNYTEAAEIRYDFDLEIINEVDNVKIKTAKEGKGVSEAVVISELKVFLML